MNDREIADKLEEMLWAEEERGIALEEENNNLRELALHLALELLDYKQAEIDELTEDDEFICSDCRAERELN